MENDTIPISRPSQQTEGTIKIQSPSPSTAPTIDPISKYPSEPIALPSEGYFYESSNPLSKGIVDIKYMTAREEDILTSQNLIKKGVVLDRLLESVIITSGVKISDLLIGDKNALFVASRRLAYGDNYGPIEVDCPKCGFKHDITINLADIKTKDFDFSKYVKGQNSFDFVLKVSKKNIKYKLLTHQDEKEIDADLEALSKLKKESGAEITTRLKRVIVEIDGKSDKATINKFVDTELTSRDSLELRNHIRENTPDIDMTFDFNCSQCDRKERIGVPLTVHFFWPSS